MKKWLHPLISGVVLTICVLTVWWVADCHILSRGRDEPPVGICKDADSRGLATLMGLLSTLLALAVKTDDDTPAGAGRSADSAEVGALPLGRGDDRSVSPDLAGTGGRQRGSADQGAGGGEGPHR